MLKSSQSTTVAESGGGKNSHTGRPQTVTSTTLAKSIVPSDEFKTGFPSEGLSTFSNKWWGSGFPDGYDGAAAAGGESAERCENEEKDVGPTPKGTGLLMDMRKRAVEEGRESLKLGVVRGFSGATKLGKRDKALLLRILNSSAPQEWINSYA